MSINLLSESNRNKPVNLLSEKTPTDLLEEPENSLTFDELSPSDQEKVMEMAKQKISSTHPNMPDWLRDMILHVTPKDNLPNLESSVRGVTDVTNYIPAVAGGLLQGASIPIRGVASTIPTDFTQKLANSPDLRGLFPKAETAGQKGVQDTGEFFGALGPLGKMFGALKGGAQLAKIPKAGQNVAALAGTGYLGTPGDAEDKARAAAASLALGAAGKAASKVAGKVSETIPAFMRGLTNKSTPEALVKAAQKPHDILKNTEDKLYGQVKEAIKKRNITIPVKEQYLDAAIEILPKTRASRQLIDKARSGDYDAVHDLQSHLYKKGAKALASDDIALENQGEEILELRSKINDSLESHLLKEGHIDVAHVLRQAKKVHKDIMNTYYGKDLRKGIGKLVNQDLRLIPENPEKLFTQNSVPMKRFLDKHPEVAQHTQGIKEKEAAVKALNSLFTKGGIAGGLTFGTKTIYDLFK